MMIDIINGILIRELNTQILNGYVNTIQMIMIIHYDDFDANICETNNYDTNTFVINEIDLQLMHECFL